MAGLPIGNGNEFLCTLAKPHARNGKCGTTAAFAESGLIQCAIDDCLFGLGIKFGMLPDVSWVQSLAQCALRAEIGGPILHGSCEGWGFSRRNSSKVGAPGTIAIWKKAVRCKLHLSEAFLKSKIFLSCGQRGQEIKVAREIKKRLTSRGFKVYIALDVQSISEINAGIIDELKDSDFYLFVNFRREQLGKNAQGEKEFRGSLFSHQEFAIAYALGFNQKILVVNQTHVKREGMVQHFGCNTKEFDSSRDCTAVVTQAVRRARWRPDYSRRLRAGHIRISKVINYASDDTGVALKGRMICLKIHNGRPDIAALETTGRLVSYRPNGSTTSKRPKFRSALKATASPAYSHTIFPQSAEEFDLLCLGYSLHSPGEQQHVYLNTALDLIPTPYLKITPGVSELTYEFYAINFPILRVVIRLRWPKTGRPTARVLEQVVS